MKTMFTILAFASLSFITSCDVFDKEPELPPITTEGKGTFGCLVNGKLFLPNAPLGYGSGVYAELQTYPDTLGISIYVSNSATKQTLVIFIYDTPTLEVGKVYNLTHAKFSVDYIEYSDMSSCRYQTIIDGSLTLLKLDIANPERMIAAGTFEFEESSIDCQDTIIVTSGRFDISDVSYQ